LLEFLAADWIAMMCTFAAIYLLGNKKRSGFVVMMSGNACRIGVACMAGSVAMAADNVVFPAMNPRGLVKWSPDQGKRNKTGPD
jgi:hypothetical protein